MSLIESIKSSGKIFGATYLKANGEVTKINGRFGVHKFLKGTGVSSSSVLTIWDNNRKRYTSLKQERIIDITFKGQRYEI